ncbi:hypothetical protein M0R45_035558 [Rubus argutus]|uniref:Uncharacterized protein n=1 Tax=Rubus argutus TaxID=59490 RepID=A0AAW1VUB3_RUBAR
MADEQLAVVGDTWCISRLHRVIKPEKALLCTKFLLDIKATIRRLHGVNTNFEDDHEDLIDILLAEDKWSANENGVTVELEHDDPYDVNVDAISQVLSHLQVPLQAHESLVDTILFRSYESARNCGSCVDLKILHMEISVDLYVV